MDDIGNLVYIIVFAIWFLYRVFGKGSKKTTKPMPPFDSGAPEQEPRTQPQESTRPPITFEDVLRELTGAPQTTTLDEPDNIPPSYPTEDVAPETRDTGFEIYETPQEVAPEKVVTSEKFRGFEIRKSSGISSAAKRATKMLRSKNGAKQAFIMKEIFDRPYQ